MRAPDDRGRSILVFRALDNYPLERGMRVKILQELATSVNPFLTLELSFEELEG